MKFTIPGRLPGLNEIVNVARGNRFAGASQKKKMTQLCMAWINAAQVPKFVGPVMVHFDWYEETQRRDPDNVRSGAKFILDALVERERITNDSVRYIKGMSDTFHHDAENPRVEITIQAI